MVKGSRKFLLGNVPNEIDQNQAEYLEGALLVERVQKDLLARHLSVEACRDIINHLRDKDTPTRQRLERILAFKGQRSGDITNRVAKITAEMKRKPARMV